MVKFKKISDEKMAFLLFALCWAAYFTSYIGRLNYSSAMTAILPEMQNRTDAISIAIHFFTSYLFIWHLLHCRILPAKICLSHQERSGNRS